MAPTFKDRLDFLARRLVVLGDDFPPLKAEPIYNVAAELRTLGTEIAYVLEPSEGQFPSPAQALALGRFMGNVMRDDRFADRDNKRWGPWAKVSRGGAGLGDDYLYVELGDGYTGGIDREDRVST